MTQGELAAWIEYVGKPMERDVEALKRAMWTMFGGGTGVGVVVGLLAPFLLKKMGLG
jgi:hypothetical protein